jgi:pyruvate formate lyase activating enzyme
VEVVKQYRVSLKTMRGGLTISGGEPLLQHRFVLKVFEGVHQAGIHTALETNGYFGARLTDEDFDSIDLVLLGLKAITPDLHKRLTGMDNGPVQEFARRLAARKQPVWIRFIVVPGWTDNMDEIGKMADFAASLGNVERVDVLPFHQMGRFKWEKLGMEYQMRDAAVPPRETMEAAIARFRSAGLNVV